MRLLRILLLIAAVTLAAVPAFGQTDADLVEVAAVDGELTTFVAALQATGIADILQGPGPFTVFAPTDGAFAAAFSDLGITVEQFMADTNMVRAVLLGHIVNGLVPSSSVTTPGTAQAMDGTILQIEPRNGLLVVNGSINVLRADIPAANGLIHALGAVLLPPSLAVTIQPTPVPEVEPARFRVAHFSPDMRPFTFSLDGVLSETGPLSFGQVSEWITLPPAVYDLALVAMDAASDEDVFGPLGLTLVPGSWTTGAIIGSPSDNSLTIAFMDQAVGVPILENYNRLTFFHAIPDAGPVDILLAADLVILDGIAFGEYASVDLPSASYNIQVVPAGTNDPPLLTMNDFTLEPATHTLVGLAGTGAAASVAVHTVSSESIAMLVSAASPPATPVPSFPEVTDIFDTLAADGRFLTLIGIIRAAGIETIVRGDGPFTLFAPTDEAFAALPPGRVTALLANPIEASNLLLYHLLPSAVPASALTDQANVATILGPNILLSPADGDLLLNGTARLVIADIQAANGLIHVVDGVLEPPA